jgi:Fungal specific transcription factor domain.
VTLGRPVALRDEDIDVPLPTAFDIDELPLEELFNGTKISRLQYKSPFLHLIGIRKIAGKVLQSIHCASKPDTRSAEEKLSIRRELQVELEAWKSDIPKVKIPAPKHNSIPVSSFRSKVWYEVPYHNALLLLYRPSPMFPPVPSSYSSPNGTSVTGLNDILLSAVSAIHLYAELHRTRRLNYSWITLHAVFIAGLSYVYSISRIIKASTSRSDTLPICLEYTRVIDVTRTCSNVLVAINERWGTARDSCEIFDRLSTAIIQDSVKAQLEVNNRHTTSKNVGPSPSPNVPHQHSLQPTTHLLQPEQETRVQDESHLVRNNEETSTSGALYDSSFQLIFSDSYPVPTAENGFREFSQNLHDQNSHEFSDLGAIPSEVAVGFSQGWFADDIGMTDVQSSGHVYNDIFMEPFG